MSEPIIQIEHLNKTFGAGPTAVHALEDINLAVQPGEIFGIIGLSGAGKSTLVRCMNLLERPTSGSVVVDGKEMTKLSTKDLNRDPAEHRHDFPAASTCSCSAPALDNVCFPMEIAGVQAAAKPRSGPWNCWTWWACPTRPDAYPAQLSGGQKQRVAIARALAYQTPRCCCATRPPPPWTPPPPASILAPASRTSTSAWVSPS